MRTVLNSIHEYLAIRLAVSAVEQMTFDVVCNFGGATGKTNHVTPVKMVDGFNGPNVVSKLTVFNPGTQGNGVEVCKVCHGEHHPLMRVDLPPLSTLVTNDNDDGWSIVSDEGVVTPVKVKEEVPPPPPDDPPAPPPPPDPPKPDEDEKPKDELE